MIRVTYHIYPAGDEDLDHKIDSLCLEQSVELPRSVLSGRVEREATGSVLARRPLEREGCEVTVGWPTENIGGDLTQFLNVLYGNISLQDGIRVMSVNWHTLPGEWCGGPAFGVRKLRERYGIHGRPLCATALKPLGSTPEELGTLCRRFAAGGMDVIKDDHGIADQSRAPFEPRLRSCLEGVRRAAEDSGRRARYFVNITARADRCVNRYRMAAEEGADGVLVSPHLVGLETMHRLARMDFPLPIIAHPSFSGALTAGSRRGLAPGLLYGEIWRAMGADFVIYPNAGGRFPFTRRECEAINRSARTGDLPFRGAFPMPGGGITREVLPRWVESYGEDTVFLLGSSLYEHPGGIRKAAEELAAAIR